MFWSIALSIARRNRGFIEASAPPMRAATVTSRMRRVKILPRLASVAAFLCLMFAHLLWPAMTASLRSPSSVKLYQPLQDALLREELREHVEPHFAVVDFEHALLDGQRQRKQFGKSIAD